MTTPAEEFEGFLRKWQGALNLLDWRVVVDKKRAPKGVMADVATQFDDRLAVVRVGADPGTSPHEREDTACHEMLHVLLRELNAPEEARAAAEHRVVHTLVRLLVPRPKAEADA
jgi:hypothetical protein